MALREESGWSYGYDLARATGLKSGTLYPILARLASRGLLESVWEQAPPEGRPRRHLYRLTAVGAQMAATLPSERPARRSAGRTVAEPGQA